VAGEGLATVAEAPCDAAIVDLKLPDLSGLDLLPAIKASSPGTEVIVITAHASLSSAIQAVNEGALAYLEKPFSMDQLLATLGRALERKRAEEMRHRLAAIVVGLIKDMTERETAEAARREMSELRAITLLAGGVAHEVSNPLAVIMGQLELLLATHLPKGGIMARRLEQALEAGEQIKAIVAQMMKITRIETAPTDDGLPPVLDIRKSSDRRVSSAA
jgi:response regulator RpfG family c-di-GMP phosphodiesterase